MSVWDAPDSGASQPVSVPGIDAPSSSVAGREPEKPARDVPPLPMPLRPMTVPDLLDGGFAILRRRPRDVITLAAMFVLPVQLLSTVLLRDVLDQGAFSGLSDPTTILSTNDAGGTVGGDAVLWSLLVETLSLTLLAGALAHLVVNWYLGVDVTPRQAMRAVRGKLWKLLVAVVLVHILEAIGMFGLGVGAYVAMGLLHIVTPVVMAESAGPIRAIRRSAKLTSSRFWTSMLVPGLVIFVTLMLAPGFQTLAEVATIATPQSWDWLVRAVGGLMAQMIVLPFTAGVAVLYYLDLRVRREGLDLELRREATFGGADSWGSA